MKYKNAFIAFNAGFFINTLTKKLAINIGILENTKIMYVNNSLGTFKCFKVPNKICIQKPSIYKTTIPITLAIFSIKPYLLQKMLKIKTEFKAYAITDIYFAPQQRNGI